MTSLVPLFPSWGWRGSVDTALPTSPCDLLSTVDHPDKPLSISGPRGYCDRSTLLYLSLLALPLSWSADCLLSVTRAFHYQSQYLVSRWWLPGSKGGGQWRQDPIRGESQGGEMEPTGPPHLWGKVQWRSSTVFFIPVLHILLLCDFPNVPCSVPIFVRV